MLVLALCLVRIVSNLRNTLSYIRELQNLLLMMMTMTIMIRAADSGVFRLNRAERNPTNLWAGPTFRKDIFIARSELRKVLFFGAVSLCVFLFAYEISREPLNGLAPNSHGRRAWSLARASLKVKVKGKGQGHQGQKRHFSTLSAACVRFMFGKTSSASSSGSSGHFPMSLSIDPHEGINK